MLKTKGILFGSLIVLAGVACVLSTGALAAPVTEGMAQSEEATREDVRMQLQFAPEVISVLGPNASDKGTGSSKGAGAGIAIVYGLSEKFGIGSGIRHVVAAAKETRAVFTQFDVRLAFALTGSLALDAAAFENASRRALGGLRAQVFAGQYYFSGEVTPYSGLGLGTHYEISASRRINYLVGVRADRISNGSSVLYPLQLAGGVGLRF